MATDHTASTWAEGVRRLVEEDFPQARRITLVLDNLSTHSGASLYKNFPPAKARALLDKLALVYTPEARQLAEHGRVGVQRAGPAMPGPADSRPRGVARASQRVDRTTQPDEQGRSLALCRR